MKIILTSTLAALFVLPQITHAQIIQPKAKGMNHVIISPATPHTANEKTSNEEDIKKAIIDAIDAPLDKNKTTISKPIMVQSLTSEKKDIPYFSNTDTLEEWPYLNKLLSSNNNDKVFGVTRTEEFIERAAPMTLLLLAEYYADRKHNEQAAFYLYAAQMRAHFDMKRWPVVGKGEFPARDKDHPAHDVLALSKTVSSKVAGWFVARKPRAENILRRIEKWDEETPYAYKPTYELPSTTDIETWPALHEDATKAFIKKQRDMLDLIHP